jgi:hypothetical protein
MNEMQNNNGTSDGTRDETINAAKDGTKHDPRNTE